MPVVFDTPQTGKVVFDKQSSGRVVFDKPSIGGASKQFLIGAGNSAAFNVPELVNKQFFDELESPHISERIARGAGTAVGSVVGLPGLAFKIGSKIALKGIAKVAPKIVANADKGSKVAKAMIEGSGGFGLLNAVDPSVPIEDKPRHVLEGIIAGGVTGVTLHAIPQVFKSIVNRNKNLSIKTKNVLNEVTKPPSLLSTTGQEINPAPRTDLVPSMKRMVPSDANGLLDDLAKRQTEILAADRGIIPAKMQVDLSRNIDAGKILNEWTPGKTVNTESMFAMRINLVDRLGKLGDNPSKDAIEQLSKDLIKADAMASETARTLGALNKTQSMAAEQLRVMNEYISKLDLEAQGAAKSLFKQFKTPGFWDKFFEYRNAALLSSPYTHVRNSVGNTIGRLYRVPEKIMAGGADAIEATLRGTPRSRYASEGIADVIGMVQGFRPAIRNSIEALQDENFVSDQRIFEAVNHNRAISGMKGKMIRLPYRALTAMDEFFSTLGENASLYSQATRQAIKENAKDFSGRVAGLVKNPSIEMMEKSASEALIDTFRQPLGKAGVHIQSFLKESPVGRFILPFFRTPVNLFKWSFDRGATSIISPANWKSIMQGTQEQRSEAIGRIALSQMVTAGIAMEVKMGNITGRLSDDKNKRDALMRQGIQPYSIKIGNKYVSYRSYEPISSWIALVANTMEISKQDASIDENKTSTIVAETMKMMKDQSFLKGISVLTDALDDPERRGPAFIKNSVSSTLVPSVIGYIARLQDPIIREPNSIPDSIKSRLPYFSKGVSAKLDVWGRPITKEGTLMEKALLPSNVTTLKPDFTEQELLSLEKFPEKINKSYKGLPLTLKERNDVTKVEGSAAKALLDRAFQTKEYQSMSIDQQRDLADKIISSTRTNVRKAMLTPKFIEKLRELKTEEEKIKLIKKFTNKKLIKK